MQLMVLGVLIIQHSRAGSTASNLKIVATFPNNLLLSVSGASPQIEQALHANLMYRSRKDGSSFVTVDRERSIDLSVPILHISGLSDIVTPRPSGFFGTGSGGLYRAADIRNAYLGCESSYNQSLDGTLVRS